MFWFIFGLVIGGVIGMLVMAILASGAKEEEVREHILEESLE